MTLEMADSINSPQTTNSPIPQLIRHSPVVAGYNGGNSWPTYPIYKAARPDLPASHVVSIVLHVNHVGRCLDIENGGAVASEAPGWLKSKNADRTHGKPWLYTSASNIQAIVNACTAAGIPRSEYYIWSAHFTGSPHICAPKVCGFPPADGTQYSDKGAENCDLSILNDYMVGPALPPPPPPPPADPHHYERFDTAKRLLFGLRYSELETVKGYDKLRAASHPDKMKLAGYRARCRVLAARLWGIAHMPGKGGFAPFHRGWRFQQLRARAKGGLV